MDTITDFSEVVGIVYLGCNDNPDNWYEITEIEYMELTKEEETYEF